MAIHPPPPPPLNWADSGHPVNLPMGTALMFYFLSFFVRKIFYLFQKIGGGRVLGSANHPLHHPLYASLNRGKTEPGAPLWVGVECTRKWSSLHSLSREITFPGTGEQAPFYSCQGTPHNLAPTDDASGHKFGHSYTSLPRKLEYLRGTYPLGLS